jgi:hypothetical protein
VWANNGLFNRFIVGVFGSLAAVTYYATPYEMVSNLNIIPSAVAGVLFQNLQLYIKRIKNTAYLFGKGTQYIFLILFPVTLVLITFSYVLEFGLMLNLQKERICITVVSYWTIFISLYNYLTLIRSGRLIYPKLHFIELPFIIHYMVLTSSYGIRDLTVA